MGIIRKIYHCLGGVEVAPCVAFFNVHLRVVFWSGGNGRRRRIAEPLQLLLTSSPLAVMGISVMRKGHKESSGEEQGGT